ncbi:MAG: diaminopimelate epimerase [bacterium]|nr:diaminopimelate epimerase [bacterium]
MNFTKMQGCANDYIYINCFDTIIKNPSKLAIKMSKRHFSVGSDGLVLICRSEVADAKMRMFNADGSEGKMCGNAIRCVGKYLYDKKIITKTLVTIETLSGIKYLDLHVTNNKVDKVTVNMGKAIFEVNKIPVVFSEKEMINAECEILGKKYNLTSVSMGNPHSVIYMDEIKDLDLDKIGPSFENNPIYPEKVNTEFCKVIDKNHLEMRVYERGSGETYACGTGACALVAASIKNKICNFNEDVYVKLLGGTLIINIDNSYNVLMTGPAELVYEGVYEYED